MSKSVERFWAKVEKKTEDGDCWRWCGWIDRGYGKYRPNGDPDEPPVKVHRFAYELLVGPIPEGQTLDHLCRNKACVNPDHMEPVSIAVNTRRAHRYCAAVSDVCKRGHKWAEWGFFDAANRVMRCRQCVRGYSQKAVQVQQLR